MAGRPRLQALAYEIEMRGGDDWLWEQIVDGRSIKDICDELGVTRWTLYAWRDMEPHKERRRKEWAEAVKLSAHALVEEAGDELNIPGAPTPALVSLANSRANHKRWLASKRNREDYGDQPLVQLNQLSIGQLHLDALRAKGSMQLARELGRLPSNAIQAAEGSNVGALPGATEPLPAEVVEEEAS